MKGAWPANPHATYAATHSLRARKHRNFPAETGDHLRSSRFDASEKQNSRAIAKRRRNFAA